MASNGVGYESRLAGDWTISGIVHQLEVIICAESEHLDQTEKTFTIDCGAIERIDMAGMQLLYVWLNCVRMRGIQPRLINLPARIREAIGNMGYSDAFAEIAQSNPAAKSSPR